MQQYHRRLLILSLLTAGAITACRSNGEGEMGQGGSTGSEGGAAGGGAAGASNQGGTNVVGGSGGIQTGGTASGGTGGRAGNAGTGGTAATGGTMGTGGTRTGGTAATGGALGTGGQVVGEGATSLRGDGVILWDNVPAFPNGIYYNGRNRTPAQIDSDMQVISAAGFNVIEASQLMGWTDVGRFLSTCQKLGLRVSAEIWVDQAAAQAFIEKWKSHPTIWAWDVADDSHRRFTVAQVREMNTKVKTWDPKHLTAQTVYDPSVMGPFMALTDMVWPYRYPVYNKTEGSDLGAVSWIMNASRSYKTPLVGIPQAYLWGDNANDRYPSAAEYRNMVWQYLIGGARGLLPYSFTDSGLLPTVAPGLWAAMTSVNTELKAFLPYLRLGTYTGPNTTDENVKVAFWQMGPSCLVAMENHRTFAGAVSVGIPAGCTGTKLVGADGQSIARNNGSLTGSLAPLQVRVFTLEP
jgi:hypothetical protein